MSSGFVSGGTTEKPVERDDDWLKAQQEIEANRRRRQEEGKQDGGKSLYEVLQNNKAAKQEAFEESIRLKNQFRTLDEDEVEFLDSVLESTRAKEEAVKKETSEQLNLFRRQQEEANRLALKQDVDADTGPSREAGSPTESQSAETQWAVNARKRRRAKEKESISGIKLRKTSTTGEKDTLDFLETTPTLANQKSFTDKTLPPHTEAPDSSPHERLEYRRNPIEQPKTASTTAAAAPKFVVLGLSAYSSDDED